MKWTGRIVAFALLALVCQLGNDARAAGKRSDAVVKVAATASKIDAAGKQTVTVTLDVDKGWHIYANPVLDDMLASIQTVVSVDAKTAPKEVKVIYPAGKLHEKDGEKYSYYVGKVTIQVQVQRAAGDTSPLDATIRFSACDSSSCLFPATKKISLP